MSILKYYKLAKKKLFPICRSITGKGIRKTLKIIKDEFPKLKIYYCSSGKKVFDWEIPKVWEIKDAFIITPDNKKICNLSANNLHVVGYSQKINKEIYNLYINEILCYTF